MSSEYKAAFFVVPSRILDLPDLNFAHLRIYETVYQFWAHEKDCYLSNPAIMQRVNCHSESTIREAFLYFEKHNEMKRVYVNGRRYLVQPERKVEIDEQKEPVDKSKDGCTKTSQGVATATGGRRHSDGGGVATATVSNRKKYNNKKINSASVDIIEIPLWLDKDLWEEFREHRRHIKKPMTQLAEKKMINRLDRIKNNGHDIVEVLNKSIRLGWQDVFEPEAPKVKKPFPNNNEVRSTVKEWTPGNPDYDRLHSTRAH